MPRPPTRGQHRRGRYPHQATHTVTRYADRVAPLVVLARLQQHPHSTPLHSLCGEYLGRYTYPRAGHRGLATQPTTLRTPSGPVGPPLYRPLRIHAQHSGAALQLKMARPPIRRRRVHAPPRRGVAPRAQLLQPFVDCSPNPRCQAAPVKRNRYRLGPLMAQKVVVPRPPAIRISCPTFPASTGHVLPRQARQARGGRTTRMEHRGLWSNTPS
jgi:hypothetical protein